MSIQKREWVACDRCLCRIDEVPDVFDDEHRPDLIIEAAGLGVEITSLADLCDECKKELPPLIAEVLSKKREAMKNEK